MEVQRGKQKYLVYVLPVFTYDLYTVEYPPDPHKHRTEQTLVEPVGGGSDLSFPLTEIMSVVLLPSRKQLLIKEELFGWVGTNFFSLKY